MKHFLRSTGEIVEANSPHVIAQITTDRIAVKARSRVGAAFVSSKREYNMQTQLKHA